MLNLPIRLLRAFICLGFRFQKACVKYGVPDVDLFQAVDLMERKNIAQVTNTIFAIGRTVFNFLMIRYHCHFVTFSDEFINDLTYPSTFVQFKSHAICNAFIFTLNKSN